MTATFGKLEQKTLTLEPGLNVIQAPNEWGKSTWCAFLTAMLYGLDTRSHSTKTALSDKERYCPWSGTPMAGRIDLNWNGKDITIERKNKGRTVFGDFRAYETTSGLPVPELTAQNCGQQLLGVEKSVFTRSAMIRQADLPVTQDDALRRRLNALVTTGDDSGASEDLERRLRELKNRCRYNRIGLLPQAEADAAEVDRKLRELELLESQSRKLRQRSSALETHISDLENHRTSLAYHAALENARLRRNAEIKLQQTEEQLRNLEAQCAGLPDRALALERFEALQRLQSQWAQVQIEADRTRTMPIHPLFSGMTPEEATERVHCDIDRYQRLRKRHLWIPLLALLLLAAGIAAILTAPKYRIFGYCSTGAGVLIPVIWSVLTAVRFSGAAKIVAHYGSRSTAKWLSDLQDYVNQCVSFQHTASQYQESVAALRLKTEQLCQGKPLPEALSHWQTVCDQWDAIDNARHEYRQHRDRLATFRTLPADAPAPQQPDTLTLSESQTQAALADTARELRELQHRLGQYQGQMEALGHRTVLECRREELQLRIRRLEETYAALELAISTLEQARTTLQRRFAPRITARARDILSRLTDGRYDRLALDTDLTLHATARDESSLRSALWRSDGTADLLYLALRLAVAEELMPDSPLILDDALVRFDDQRLAQAMEVLNETARQKQIILFTCHSRESQYV